MIRVRKWENYQHRDAARRRRGGLLFIRLDVGTRRQSEFSGRGGRARYGQWCAILEWAGETGNKIPCDPTSWRREFGTHWAEIVAWFVNSGKLEMSDMCPTCVRLVPNSDNPRDQLVPDSDIETTQKAALTLVPAGDTAGDNAGTEEKREETTNNVDVGSTDVTSKEDVDEAPTHDLPIGWRQLLDRATG